MIINVTKKFEKVFDKNIYLFLAFDVFIALRIMLEYDSEKL